MMLYDSIVAATTALHADTVSAQALALEALEAVDATRHLNIVAAIDRDAVLADARDRDRERAAGRQAGLLHGIPITIKDLFAVAGLPTRAGTKAPLPDLGHEEAVAVARLRAAGAVILAKVNMHEVALGLTGENPWSGDVKNPADPLRQAGGSSSGSAAAVAAGIGYASLGTDTGGSIRVPAALCGTVGFKPTWGLVPLDGALALSPTCDHAGPLTRSVEDARIVAEVLAGRSLPPSIVSAPTFGVPSAYLEGRLAADVRHAFDALIARLRRTGVHVRDVDIVDLELTAGAYTPLVRAEAAYVHRSALATSRDGFSDTVQAALVAGLSLSAVDYLEARAARRRVRCGLDVMFQHSGIDALIMPATPTQAMPRGTTIVDIESGPALQREAQLALTAPFSLVGAPVVSLPFARVGGLPLGLQVITSWNEDAKALSVAEWLEHHLAAHT